MKKQIKNESAKGRITQPRDAEKSELDLQTSYVTLLPHMEEGFHTGYHSRPGIVSDTNARPYEWLENVAKYMQTPGEDVGYSIPDVLAREQQMRRLIRLPHEEAARHQEMVNWRAILALLLLWDSWERDETWPVIAFEDFLTEESLQNARMFQYTVSTALSEERAQDGLQVFTIAGEQDHKPDKRPLCMVSRAVIIVPAASSGDLSEILPKQVRWYDRIRKRFEDPCQYLEERDRVRLVLQLRLLQSMNEQAAIGSLLYSPEAQLCSLLERFIDDLQGFRSTWRESLERRDAQSVHALYIRTLAVFGLMNPRMNMHIGGLAEMEEHMDISSLRQNILISQLLPPNAVPRAEVANVQQTQFLMDGVPFARMSANWLLEPVNHAQEEEVIKRLEQEIVLLNDFSGSWNVQLAQVLGDLYAQMRGRAGASAVVPELLREWQAKHAAFPMQQDRNILLHYPIEGHPQTLGLLMKDLLGMEDTSGIGEAFAENLLLMESLPKEPFRQADMCRTCRVEGTEGAQAEYALPPLSPWLCGWLMDEAEKDDALAASLLPGSLRFARAPGSEAVQASFRIVCKRQGENAVLTNTVTFCRHYEEKNGDGGIMRLSANQLPFVLSWPNVRLSKDLWKQYFIYAHRTDTVDVWVRQKGTWEQGIRRWVFEGNETGGKRREWQTARAERFPSYVVLKKGAVTLGAIWNEAPREMLKHEPPAVIGIDFGSIATTVMMRQGDKVQSAVFPQCLHAALLHVQEEDTAYLADEFLPADALLPYTENSAVRERESTFYSVMDMFTDDPQSWQRVLRDGHIYYRKSLVDLMRKNENTLYYDMKWSDESVVIQCMRLFLKQTMMQASLSARLSGAPSVSWRVSMPNALPLARQASYLEVVRSLSAEVAESTGVPLTEGIPGVLYATENQADGLYFRGRNEVNVRNGYINMDIGGGTTDISVWLNNAHQATEEASLLLGCRQILFDSVSTRHLATFEKDFERSGERVKRVVNNLTQALGLSAVSTRGRQKSMFLLDDFFADYDREIWKMMAQARSEGRISYVESLLLLNIGFLFHMCGEMLNRTWKTPETQKYLHGRMDICIAGNGGQLLKAFDNDTRTKLCNLALLALDEDHPVREMLLIQSRHPKQEVAIGLLSDEQRMRSTIQGESNRLPGDDMPRTQHQRVLRSFPVRFFEAFPQAAERLLPTVFEMAHGTRSVQLAKSAAMELDTVVDNEFLAGGEDDFVVYARCFAAMKRLWRV